MLISSSGLRSAGTLPALTLPPFKMLSTSSELKKPLALHKNLTLFTNFNVYCYVFASKGRNFTYQPPPLLYSVSFFVVMEEGEDSKRVCPVLNPWWFHLGGFANALALSVSSWGTLVDRWGLGTPVLAALAWLSPCLFTLLPGGHFCCLPD